MHHPLQLMKMHLFDPNPCSNAAATYHEGLGRNYFECSSTGTASGTASGSSIGEAPTPVEMRIRMHPIRLNVTTSIVDRLAPQQAPAADTMAPPRTTDRAAAVQADTTHSHRILVLDCFVLRAVSWIFQKLDFSNGPVLLTAMSRWAMV
jgi:hypothetical protein